MNQRLFLMWEQNFAVICNLERRRDVPNNVQQKRSFDGLLENLI